MTIAVMSLDAAKNEAAIFGLLGICASSTAKKFRRKMDKSSIRNG